MQSPKIIGPAYHLKNLLDIRFNIKLTNASISIIITNIITAYKTMSESPRADKLTMSSKHKI